MASTTTHKTITAAVNKSKPYFSMASLAHDGWSNEDEATATCFCGTVQLSFVSVDVNLLVYLHYSNTFSKTLANSWLWICRFFHLQLS